MILPKDKMTLDNKTTVIQQIWQICPEPFVFYKHHVSSVSKTFFFHQRNKWNSELQVLIKIIKKRLHNNEKLYKLNSTVRHFNHLHDSSLLRLWSHYRSLTFVSNPNRARPHAVSSVTAISHFYRASAHQTSHFLPTSCLLMSENLWLVNLCNRPIVCMQY